MVALVCPEGGWLLSEVGCGGCVKMETIWKAFGKLAMLESLVLFHVNECA